MKGWADGHDLGEKVERRKGTVAVLLHLQRNARVMAEVVELSSSLETGNSAGYIVLEVGMQDSSSRTHSSSSI